MPSALQEKDPNAAVATQNVEAAQNPQKPAKKSTAKAPKAKDSATQTTSTTTKAKGNKAPSASDLSHICLDGQEDEEVVEIYDTCDDIRKKMRDHMKLPGVTQASMAREFSELMPHSKVQPRQIAKFLDFKGPRAGGHSPAFYDGYVYLRN